MFKERGDYVMSGHYRETRDGKPVGFKYAQGDDISIAYARLFGNIEKRTGTLIIKTNWVLPFLYFKEEDNKALGYISTQDGRLWLIRGYRTKNEKEKQVNRFAIINPYSEYYIELSIIDNTMGIK